MAKNENRILFIFTDGACPNNQAKAKFLRVGGYAWIMKFGDKVKEFAGGERGTTNNRMELMAVISALENVSKNYKGYIIVYTDSKYVCDGYSLWLPNWVKKGWKNSQKKEPENRDLWERLLKATEDKTVEFQWIKGHAGHPENERCDQLATMAAAKLIAGSTTKKQIIIKLN